MKVLDLFSGIGGFSLALEKIGMETVAFCEIGKNQQKVLKKHWGKIPIYDDIKNLTEKELDNHGAIDLICGGIPCQGFSMVGKRDGLAGKESQLFYEFIRIVNYVKPKWIIIENVPGMLSSNAGKDMQEIITKISECGYGYAWRILDAQYFGVPQRRRRIYIIGHYGAPWGASAKILFEPESCGRHTKKSKQTGKKAPTLLASGAGTNRSAGIGSECDYLIPLNISNTLTCGNRLNHDDNYIFTKDIRLRRLTPLECVRLQGFPDDWLEGLNLSDTSKYKCVGNSVAIPVIKWIGEKIMSYEKEVKQ